MTKDSNNQANQSSKKEPGIFENFRADFLASIVVFLVALPLCIGIAVAVGVPPARALLTGIIGGLVVGFFSGSPLQVSGPAAGLFVIVADLIAKGEASFIAKFKDATPADQLDSQSFVYAMMIMGTSVFLAGVMQVVAGQLRLGQWFRAVSPAVIKGMLAGIGVLILVSQFHVMLDHKAMWHGEKAHGGLQYIATIPTAIMKCFSPHDPESIIEHPDASEGDSAQDEPSDSVANAGTQNDGSNDTDSTGGTANGDTSTTVANDQNETTAEPPKHLLAAITGLITIFCILAWPWIAPKKIQVIPAALVGIAVATIFASVAGLGIQTLEEEVKKNMFQETTLPTSTDWFLLLMDPIVLTGAFVIALVASAETLLCATAVDQLHSGVRTNYDKELTAQGFGNIACGLIGALPMTGVIVRSSANVASGAKSRLSTILHGGWLLIFVAVFPFLLAYIPRAALGALLVHIGIKLVNIKQIRNLWQTSKSECLIFFVTMIVIVCQDLLIGVITGIVLSAIKLLYRFSHLELSLVTEGKVTRLDMEGAATFMRLPQLAAKLEQVPDSAELHVSFEHLSYIDHACLDLLMNWAKQHEGTGGKLIIDWEGLNGRFAESPKENIARAKQAQSSQSLNGVVDNNGAAVDESQKV